ncbi:CLUMA_CG005396, isoform A [Clunio marinus]|uniref:CLUMA_CG005396, isoform A n=1 Tax=Clunio marinus TaxID=568069 RepID=A0A1J1HW36_9DIPT|nr:CLUMA_CG005396, isoform A [Clunio marinus]
MMRNDSMRKHIYTSLERVDMNFIVILKIFSRKVEKSETTSNQEILDSSAFQKPISSPESTRDLLNAHFKIDSNSDSMNEFSKIEVLCTIKTQQRHDKETQIKIQS